MAQKYGGKHSPGSTSGGPKSESFQNARRSRAGGRVNLLFLAPLPLIFRAFGNGPEALLLNLMALGALLLAAWMTREGMFAQEAYEGRKVARRPAMPRKLFGSVLTGLGLAVASFAADGGIVAPVALALVGGVLHGLAFGLDPMRDKGMDGVNTHQSDRVARAVEGAEEHLRAMNDAILRAGDRALENRVAAFQSTARDLFRTVEDDPRDLTSVRRFLGVYLQGARDATVKFSEIYSRSQNAQARTDFEALLDDLEKNFAARTQKLLLEDPGDLNIEIDVLRERLERESLHQNRQQ